jgi:hypothetical protein
MAAQPPNSSLSRELTKLSARHLAFRILVPAALAASALTALAACSSSHTTQATTQADSVAATCLKVSGVLADGPDPDADPLGYAEAQIDPLRRISTQDAALRDALSALSGAYQEFFTSNGTSTAKEAVAVASKKINSLCPGAAS